MRTPARSTSSLVFDRRAAGHHVRAFDDHVGAGEVDVGAAHRIDRQEDDIQLALLDASVTLPAASNTVNAIGTPSRLASSRARSHRYAARLAGRRVLLRQHGVAEIDRHAQLAGRSKRRDRVAWSIVCHDTRDAGEQDGKRRECCFHSLGPSKPARWRDTIAVRRPDTIGGRCILRGAKARAVPLRSNAGSPKVSIHSRELAGHPPTSS